MENFTEVTNEVVVEPSVEEMPKVAMGVLLNCEKLNVRTEPNKEADVVLVANSKTEFVIDESNSTEDWFSVRTAAGIEGFCMKKFVAVTFIDKE